MIEKLKKNVNIVSIILKNLLLIFLMISNGYDNLSKTNSSKYIIILPYL